MMTEKGMNSVETRWLKTARIFALEQWWPPYWPRIEIDWDKALWTMKRLHLDTLQANALTKWAFYPTDLIAKHPELGARDILRESEEFCDRHGFRMILYTLFGHAMPISTQLSKKYGAALFEPVLPWKPDRQPQHQVNVPPELGHAYTQWHFGGEPYVAHCVFAMEPWLMEHVGELADRYEYQAAWLDASAAAGGGWCNDGLFNVCGCPVCQESHRNDFQTDIPRLAGTKDPRVLDLRRWIQRRLDGVMERAARRMTKDCSLPMVGNLGDGGGEAAYYPDYLRHLDGGLYEHASDTLNLVRRLGQSRRFTDVAMHYPDIYDPFPRRVTSGWEVENKGLITLGFDGTPYLAQPGKYYYDDHNDEPARRIFAFMEEAKPLLERQRPEAYASVVSPLAYAAPEQHDRFARGWTQLMLDRHVPPGDLPHHLIETVDEGEEARVLLVPDVQALSDRAIEALVRFAENGGGVYFSGAVGILDENLRPRLPERLMELLDIKPWEGGPEERSRRAHFDGASTPYNRRLCYDVYHQVADPGMGFPVPDAFRIGPSELGDWIPGESWTPCAWAVPTDCDKPLMPTLAVKRVGAGRMVFTASPFESQYMDRRNDDLGAWLGALLLWLGGRPLPVEVEASKRLQVCTTVLEGGGRLVYLVNQSNDIQPKREDWWEPMKVWDRPLPLGRVRIALEGRQLKTLYGAPPDLVEQQGGWQIAVWENFTGHAVIHAEA